MKLLLIYTIINVLDAVSDALRDEGKKTWSHPIEIILIAGLLFMPFIVPFNIVAIASFILVRYFVFDFTYNIIRKLGLFYFGSTSIYDKLFRMLLVKDQAIVHVILISKIIALCVAIGLLNNYL